MSWWLCFRLLFSRRLRREQAERDLDDEIRFDLSEETRLRIERGESAQSAAVSARREFGRIAGVKEQTREAWG